MVERYKALEGMEGIKSLAWLHSCLHYVNECELLNQSVSQSVKQLKQILIDIVLCGTCPGSGCTRNRE